jgi:DNA-binding NtrC family response regulator
MLKMVVVSCDEILVKVIKRQLTLLNLEVSIALNADEALILLKSQHIDFLLTDNQLKYGMGLELAQQVREKYPQIKVMIMSGLLGRDEIPHWIRFLPKPWNVDGQDQLVEQVKEMIKEAQ